MTYNVFGGTLNLVDDVSVMTSVLFFWRTYVRQRTYNESLITGRCCSRPLHSQTTTTFIVRPTDCSSLLDDGPSYLTIVFVRNAPVLLALNLNR